MISGDSILVSLVRLVPLPSDVVAVLQQRPVPIREWFSGWNLYRLVHTISRVIQQVDLKGVTFHTLPHTFASHAVMNGVDLFPVEKLLGHKTIQQTQRYAHLAPDHMRSAVEQAARALFAPDMPRHMRQYQPRELLNLLKERNIP
jgi:integrase